MEKICKFVIRSVWICFISNVFAADKPLRVYILAGQSNMEGQAEISTFGYTGGDKNYQALLKDMRGPDGKPKICQNVWISYLTGREQNEEAYGRLTSGYGSRPEPGENGSKIGPEFTFGITLEKATDQPILIIKTAWGGKSLHTDFRPPSAGPYRLPPTLVEEWKQYPQGSHDVPKLADRKEWWKQKNKQTGLYYRLMVAHVKKVLSNIKRVCPEYDQKQGFELAGFVWFQGWNDMVDQDEYPEIENESARYNAYSELLAHFIRDIRQEFKAPKLPFVIGVMGVGGVKKTPDPFREAMAAPAKMQEFRGNVIAVQTAPFWDSALGMIEQKNEEVDQMEYFLRSKDEDHANKDGKMSAQQQQDYIKKYRTQLISPEEERMFKSGASNAAFHYLGSAKIIGLIGKAFADALQQHEKEN